MSDAEDSGVVVWQRHIDPGAGRRRWRLLGAWFAAPAVIVTAVGWLAAGPGVAGGLAICFAILGGVATLWVSVLGQAEAVNPQIRLVDGCLRDATTSVVVADVEAWTTRRRGQFSVTDGLRFPAPVALAEFRLASASAPGRVSATVPASEGDAVGGTPRAGDRGDGIVAFPWPEMGAAELDAVRAALEPHIPAPWVPPDRLGG